MKKILLILLFIIPFGLFAQTEKEILVKLSEKMDKLSEKVDKLAEQQIATNLEIKGITTEIKGIDKRLDFSNMLVIAIFGLFGVLIAVIVWDRRTVTKPFESKTEKLEKANEKLEQEVLLLKEQQLKNINILKKYAETEPKFAEIFRNASIL